MNARLRLPEEYWNFITQAYWQLRTESAKNSADSQWRTAHWTKTDKWTSKLSEAKQNRGVAPNRGSRSVFFFFFFFFVLRCIWLISGPLSPEITDTFNPSVSLSPNPPKILLSLKIVSLINMMFLFPFGSKRTVMSVSGLKEEVLSLYHTWRGCCGVLLFLYSVILTKVKENSWVEIWRKILNTDWKWWVCWCLLSNVYKAKWN